MRGNGGNKGQGSNWCNKVKRLAIHLRDGMACVFCDKGVDEGKVLTVDHLIPRSKRGTHRAHNLVTACMSCNAGRRDRKWYAGLHPERRALIHRLRRRCVARHYLHARELLGRGLTVQWAATPEHALGISPL